jgi:hypothetical protein
MHRAPSPRHWPLATRLAIRVTGAALLMATATVAVLGTPMAGAATDSVTNCSGDATTSGSLPFVVSQAAAGDTVTFSVTCPAGSPIVLSQTLAIGVDLTIDGPGSGSLAVSGGDTVEVVSVAHGVTAAISGLTIENGHAGSGAPGTAAPNANGANASVNGGSGGNGLTGSIGGNSGAGDNGGGIDNAGTLTLTDTVVTGNAAGAGTSGGAGGDANGGNGANSTSGDGGAGGNGGTGGAGGPGGAGGSGGGIYSSGTLSLVASTVSNNAAGAGGAGGVGGSVDGGAGGAAAAASNNGFTGGAGGRGGTLSGAGGNGGVGGSGGGIYSSGTLSLVASTVSGNAAGAGGQGGRSGDADSGNGGVGGGGVGDAVGGNGGAAGTAGIVDRGGHGGAGGAGGGIDDADTATVTNSTVTGNAAGGGGRGGPGGHADGGVGGLGGSDLNGKGDGGSGGTGGNGGSGGIGGDGGSGAGGGGLTDTGSLTLASSTIASNAARAGGAGGNGGGSPGGSGGAAGAGSAAPGTSGDAGAGGLTGDSGSGGTGGSGGGVDASGSVTAGATIVNDNSPANCALVGTVIDAGSNLDSDDTCGFTLASDVVGTDADLGALQANGGPTFTMAPSQSPKSPVIDVMPANQCPATDQRGAPRTAPCDIGAYDTDQAPFTMAIDVTVSGSQTFGSNSPTFTETDDAPNGVTVSGPGTCTTVDGGTPINSSLGTGDHTVDGATCSGFVSSNPDYPVFPSSTVGAVNGFVVTAKDSTSVELSAAPASEPFGSEASTAFTVTVFTGQGEELAGSENVTVDVGTTSCVALVAPTTGGGSGSCSIGNSALAAGDYTASASYPGDDDLTGSGPSQADFAVTLALTPPPLPNPVFGVNYSTTISAGGATAPTTFTETGSLPDGITLHTNGVLTGTPTNAGQIGTAFPFTVKATDSASPANVATQLYSITVASSCGAGLTTHVLSATSRTGSFTGVFCVNVFGSGTYTQGAVHGTGTITSSGGVTHISAFGTNLALIGQKTTTTSTFTETAPPPAKAGTFTLS